MSDEKLYIKQLKTGNNLGAFKVTADSLTAPTTSLIGPNELIPGYSIDITSFVVGSDRLDDDSSVITKDNRMLFDKVKGAFRAGTANSSQWDNVNRGTYSIALGRNSTASGSDSFAVGLNNIASGINAIAIGNGNSVSNSTTGTTPVAIGQGNTININSQWGIAIGKNNTTSTGNSPILIGNTNSSGSGHNSVAIGELNIASSGNTLALGTNATVSKSFSFLWNGDNTSGTTSVAHELLSSEISGSTTFWCSGTGTFRINFGSNAPAAAVNSATGYAWASSSDINLKENLIEHTYSDTLDKIMEMPIYTYNFKESPSGIKCIGPVAQDFNRLFPSDKDQLSIAERDMCGVALAGVKGVKLGLDSLSNTVNSRFETVDSRFTSSTDATSALQARIDVLESLLTTAITRITTLENA